MADNNDRTAEIKAIVEAYMERHTAGDVDGIIVEVDVKEGAFVEVGPVK